MTENDKPTSIQRMTRGRAADREGLDFKQSNCVAHNTYRNWSLRSIVEASKHSQTRCKRGASPGFLD